PPPPDGAPPLPRGHGLPRDETAGRELRTAGLRRLGPHPELAEAGPTVQPVDGGSAPDGARQELADAVARDVPRLQLKPAAADDELPHHASAAPELERPHRAPSGHDRREPVSEPDDTRAVRSRNLPRRRPQPFERVQPRVPDEVDVLRVGDDRRVLPVRERPQELS